MEVLDRSAAPQTVSSTELLALENQVRTAAEADPLVATSELELDELPEEQLSRVSGGSGPHTVLS